MCRPAGWSVYGHIQSLPTPVYGPTCFTIVPVVLTSIIMKCFERLVKDHITSTLPDTQDQLQFAYHPNRSTDDAIPISLPTVLSHLDKRNTYVRMLFIDYNSPFNTIVPSKLIIKLGALGLSPTLRIWVLDYLRGRPPGGVGRKQHLHFADPQHRGPTRVHAQPPPVLPVHP